MFNTPVLSTKVLIHLSSLDSLFNTQFLHSKCLTHPFSLESSNKSYPLPIIMPIAPLIHSNVTQFPPQKLCLIHLKKKKKKSGMLHSDKACNVASFNTIYLVSETLRVLSQKPNTRNLRNLERSIFWCLIKQV